ncbi:Putative non-heme bromoperoxidase BpoC [Legionella massiliensis]|uniref:Putative non-heme bromoperoxidase BpoC n=1 Tax=Legionella massiliensis TaxID=1034943 RepID=A0A078L0H1_9GAMM|nr:alpha/beta hydrolase [Legionella massiliensis]CDZ77544.1 Putative non-heme bromoperoxidase BpoC [Legionella massiliensis]CEE13282.1 Putative non-heme bromoperoxidase BpoC [Legionella massiliensis]
MAFLKVNGASIYYEVHGQGEPLVLVAGYTCDHLFWSAMLDELAKKFQVLVFDNRAVGQTTDDGALFSLDDMAQDTMALIEHLGLKRPHILGQSMGGAIAQIIAKKYPDKIGKLIILNSTGKFNRRTDLALESLINLRKQDLSLDLLIEAAMPWFFSSAYMSDPKNIIAFKDAITGNPYPQSIEDQIRQCRNIPTFNSQSWQHEIKAPALVIAAVEDIIALPSESQELAKGINAQFVLIPGAHSSPLEQHQEVNKAVVNFLVTSQ